jgi:hypothetical protein
MQYGAATMIDELITPVEIPDVGFELDYITMSLSKYQG